MPKTATNQARSRARSRRANDGSSGGSARFATAIARPTRSAKMTLKPTQLPITAVAVPMPSPDVARPREKARPLILNETLTGDRPASRGGGAGETRRRAAVGRHLRALEAVGAALQGAGQAEGYASAFWPLRIRS